jgi:hypothetical protein
VRLRRQALQEASRGLGDATAAAALCELRAGRRTTGLRLALEALRIHRTYPLPVATAKKLEDDIARVQRNKTRTKRRR